LYFIDSSALIKAYIDEQGSTTVLTAFSQLQGYVAVSDLVALETAAALSRLVRSREIGGRVYEEARDALHNHLATRF
jgi:predicted nucleic acid-binding protein